jgi:hypothetical protein
MIRKLIIVVLTVAALTSGFLSLASFAWSFGFEPIDTTTAWLRVDFGHGGCTAYYLAYNYDGRHPNLQQTLRLGAKVQNGMLRSNINPRGRFQYLSSARGRVSGWQYVAFPLWAPFSILAAYPTIAFIRGPMRRWRRMRRGLCVACGYNLKGNVTGVCSECGNKIESP